MSELVVIRTTKEGKEKLDELVRFARSKDQRKQQVDVVTAMINLAYQRTKK